MGFWKDKVIENPDLLLKLEWMHHHLGMLQAYLDETTRVHVWHPSRLRAEADRGAL